MLNVNSFIDVQLLQESFEKLNKKSAGVIDRKTWRQYGQEFPGRSLERVHVLAWLKGMCGLKNSWCEAKIGVKAIYPCGEGIDF